MEFSFAFVDKQELEPVLPEIFHILHTNMDAIAPTGNTYEEDFAVWKEHIVPALNDDGRRMALMFCEGKLAGYFQYHIHSDLWVMEEIQIKKDYQGSGLFREFYRWLERRLPAGLASVEAYSNKANLKSQGILESLGLSRVGENSSGRSYLYRGSCAVLWERLRERRSGLLPEKPESI